MLKFEWIFVTRSPKRLKWILMKFGFDIDYNLQIIHKLPFILAFSMESTTMGARPLVNLVVTIFLLTVISEQKLYLNHQFLTIPIELQFDRWIKYIRPRYCHKCIYNGNGTYPVPIRKSLGRSTKFDISET